ncbi:YwgA family protein [Viridibacillus arvi]|uniref:YwgA family protein n=1 Tax=Viridibacillus arvi TaxID=263475 RepID=UPI00187B8464|nr:YwgA family protein [Viridibacillus sp. JNUCC-6]QOV10333.1 YwgA family protein [Viridibacillus sp. JNUCC-6]
MLEEHAKVVQFVSLAGQVTGRKKLQKMVYIAKKMRFPFQEKYQFHIYGPYSEELTLRVEELCNMGFLTEEKEDKGSYVQYRYAVTAEGTSFSTMLGKQHDKLPEVITMMNDRSARFLELVSTLLYFDELTKEEQIEKVHVVKGKLNFTEEELRDAFEFIAQLATVSIQ